MSEAINADMIVAFPKNLPTTEHEQAVLAKVRDIVSRGKVAVFTRPHRILDNMPVVKRVTNPEPDELGDLESDNGWVAPWYEAYTLTEEDPTGREARSLCLRHSATGRHQ